jgi:hypothetical protein
MVMKMELLERYGSENRTFASLLFRRWNFSKDMVLKVELLDEYGSGEENLGSI